MVSPSIYGLVLAGGASTRMLRDKAALSYHGKPQLQWTWELLDQLCERAFVSVRPDQAKDAVRAQLPQILDQLEGKGPIAGIAAAQAAHPDVAWLVLACDLPYLSRATLAYLIANRDPGRLATSFRSSHDGLPEPLCAIYEPASRTTISTYIHAGKQCPRKFLIQSDVKLLDQIDRRWLDNANTPDEFRAAGGALETRPATRTLHVQYYAVMRERAGRNEEDLVTSAATPAELYAELSRRYPFALTREQLKVAVNSEFADWSAPLRDRDSVVFIPPVAGG
ncbi:MAG TPA: NTP transferase domain-containing protein [Steroidobacteraceae bacterium]|nr:NTP transferase domain-containing protein [Steroidobacteraceae bacterium]